MEHPIYHSTEQRFILSTSPYSGLYLTCISLFQLLYDLFPLLFHLSCSACMPLLLYEELVLNVLATLNNLSYYDEPGSYVVQKQQEITEREEQTT